jgi:hypothetical protein
MKKTPLFTSLILCFIWSSVLSQSPATSGGIGIYPTGTETGFGYRSPKDKRFALDVRATRANFFAHPASGSFVTEVSAICRVVRYEKVRFHVGLGARGDWNFAEGQSHRYGLVTPVGVEAFPFPFQHAGLFFEAAPFSTWTESGMNNTGIRTVAGFVFYFLKKENN